MAVSIDVLVLIGFACESLLYGAYCVLFLASLYVLFYVWGSRGTDRTVVVLHLCLFVACTLHYALEFNHFYTYLGTSGVVGFANEDLHQFIADCVVSVADFLGDLILIYRCWIIWSCQYYIIVLPLLTSAGGLICASVVGKLVWGTTGANVSPSIVPLGLASFVLPLCTNVIVTSLMVGRIWYMSRGTAELYKVAGSSATRKAIHVMVESGMLYFAVQLVFVVVYGLNLPSDVIMIAIAVQTYGIASTLIIIHVGLGFSSEQTTNQAALSDMAWVPPSQVTATQKPTLSTALTDDDNAIDVVVAQYDGKGDTSTSGSTGSIVKYA
ncbi:uncharacterized protein PHACADRAFT_252245 [Phanerochaete carnosa HHB-10118-sp]|uniref:Uncharacterized protein n=1 Tax=Phanerochaete carnosa (strain HHB-10118-sp) TaxID=650164 RepID=K5WFR9_PHACS|nr:uncharacterized protein PHACADRAFT_252245 [Phanerochaete carnosa HHB-10118-sp]EKM58160.1 hypothetical protein PHACADRAFT_252245 [Phanerochaete carnosa HHB-10118-sp]